MAIDKKKVEEIMQVQKEKTDWNFYHERQHVENLFYSRFNFFLMLYGIFVAAATSIENPTTDLVKGLLLTGIIVLSLIWVTLYRNYQTLREVLEIIDNLPEYHSSPILSYYMGYSKTPRSKFLMAIIIPFCCIISLLIFLLCICFRDFVESLNVCCCIGGILILFLFVSFCFYAWRCLKVCVCKGNTKLSKEDKVDEVYSIMEEARIKNVSTCVNNVVNSSVSTINLLRCCKKSRKCCCSCCKACKKSCC